MKPFLALFLAAAASAQAPFRLEKAVPLPGVAGRFDHFAADVAGRRVFVAALGNDTLEAFDAVSAARLGSVASFAEPQGVGWVPDLRRLYIANGKTGTHVIRYEQNPRPLTDYRDDDDRSGYDGVTVQWFASMDEYFAHMNEVDSPEMFADLPKFLDTDHLEFVLTEEPRVIIDGEVDWTN